MFFSPAINRCQRSEYQDRPSSQRGDFGGNRIEAARAVSYLAESRGGPCRSILSGATGLTNVLD
jgi:hypothetical protein